MPTDPLGSGLLKYALATDQDSPESDGLPLMRWATSGI